MIKYDTYICFSEIIKGEMIYMNEKKLLTALEKDALVDREKLAVSLKCEVSELNETVKRLEDDKVILGYNAMVDWDKTKREYITAMIELKISPIRGEGFDKVARRIAKYPQVKSVSLMSGAYDILLSIEGRTLTEVALFVSQKLAPMDGVLSTATHFVLKKYKDKGISYDVPEEDMRGLYNI